jgi:hypothetical protein
MNKKEGYRAEIRNLLEHYFTTGDDSGIREYLVSNSNLPGPRGNLEMAHAFAEETVVLSGKRGQELWSLSSSFAGISPNEAPVNDPREIVPFCGAMAIGAIASVREEMVKEALALLKDKAADPRWRTREGVAMGLQRLIERQGSRILVDLDEWISGQEWMAMRAVAAGVAEPVLLKDRGVASAALDLHKKIIDRLLASKDRRTDEFRTLRQALGYSLSVVVSSSPQQGFEYMFQIAAISDPDVQWIVKENLKKKRLTGRYPLEVEEITTCLR